MILFIILRNPVAQGEEIVIGLGNFAPLFSTPNSPALFKDLIDGVYQYIPNRKITYRYMLSNARLVMDLNVHKVDGSANIFTSDEVNGCITQPVFSYSDVAISKKAHHFQISSVESLSELSVVSYQRATKLLGTTYKKAVNNSLFYKEVSNPEDQAKLLAAGLVDVSIGDKYIFLQSLRSWSKGKADANDYVIHDIFKPVASSMGFIQQKHCDEFDQALVKFKQDGGYQAVYDKHLKRLGYIPE
ncbi:MAG: transporter substrate-binding domain-containing protein [Thalassotalea sp.]|nr:transporter substrate-binding domain-containing protein [Thalassotalea sp.]